MKKFLVAMSLLAILVSMASLGVGANETPVLRFAADCAFPPFEIIDVVTNQPAGFDVDLAMAIGEELGMKVEFINVAWDGLIPGLLNKNFDVIASGMTITEERKLAVNFSDPYFTATQVILVPANNTTVKGPEDLKGQTVTVQIGSTGDFTASDLKGLKKVARFNLVPEAIQEVLNGNAIACIVDDNVAKRYIAEHPGAVKIVEGDFFPTEEYGLALRKTDKDLLTKVNQALAALKANGKYDQIYNKYF